MYIAICLCLDRRTVESDTTMHTSLVMLTANTLAHDHCNNYVHSNGYSYIYIYMCRHVYAELATNWIPLFVTRKAEFYNNRPLMF